MSHETQKTITTWYVDLDAEDRMADTPRSGGIS